MKGSEYNEVVKSLRKIFNNKPFRISKYEEPIYVDDVVIYKSRIFRTNQPCSGDKWLMIDLEQPGHQNLVDRSEIKYKVIFPKEAEQITIDLDTLRRGNTIKLKNGDILRKIKKSYPHSINYLRNLTSDPYYHYWDIEKVNAYSVSVIKYLTTGDLKDCIPFEAIEKTDCKDEIFKSLTVFKEDVLKESNSDEEKSNGLNQSYHHRSTQTCTSTKGSTNFELSIDKIQELVRELQKNVIPDFDLHLRGLARDYPGWLTNQPVKLWAEGPFKFEADSSLIESKKRKRKKIISDIELTELKSSYDFKSRHRRIF